MKWFKHDSLAHNDEKLRDLIHTHGMEGYGVFMVCLELIAEKIDEKLNAKTIIKDSVLREKVRLSRRKLAEILSFFHQNSLIFSKLEGENWILRCPNLLKRLDEWTKRSGVNREQVTQKNKKENENKKENKKEEVKTIVSDLANAKGIPTPTLKLSAKR